MESDRDGPRVNTRWKDNFLAELALTSDPLLAAENSGADLRKIHLLLQKEPSFLAKWEGQDEAIAIFVAGIWKFINPSLGMQLFDRTAGQMTFYQDGWIYPLAPDSPAGGNVIDQEARNAIDQILSVLGSTGAIPAP